MSEPILGLANSARHFGARLNARRRRLVIVAAGCAFAAAVGCGGGGILVPPPTTPVVWFSSWDSLSVNSCRGWLNNGGSAASKAQVELFYATALGETSRVVNVGYVPMYGKAFFLAPPQITGGEPRFPRVGKTTSEAGQGERPEEPRTPELEFINWYWTGPDSLVGFFNNHGGWAYHVAVTVENRDGVSDFVPSHSYGVISGVPLDFVPAFADLGITSVARESSGVLLPPKVLKIRWEDYGGIRDSVISPAIATTTGRRY